MPLTHRIGSKDVMILRFRGRKTGRRYSLSVGYDRGPDSVLTTTDDRLAEPLSGGAGAHPHPAQVVLDDRRGAPRTRPSHCRHDGTHCCQRALCRMLKIGKEPDGTPSRTDVEREFAGGRMPIRFTALAPSTGKI